MASRWKRVDLLRLSSVASGAAGSSSGTRSAAAAAARQRRQPRAPTTTSTTAATPPFSLTTGPSAVSSGTASSARPASSTQDALSDGPGATPRHSAGVHEDSHQTVPSPRFSTPRTCVSVSRLLCGTALPWRSALDCFHELAVGGQWRRQESAHDEDEGNNASVSHAGALRCETRMPLEAIIAMYGMLLRQERVLSPPAREGGTVATCSAAEGEMESECSVGCSADADSSASTTAGRPPLTCSPAEVTLARSFLVEAAALHAALHPIHVLLRSRSDSEADQATHAQLPSVPLPRSRLPLEPPLLGLSTVVHLGLAGALRVVSNGTPHLSGWGLWQAVEVMHHLQQYGWGPDYLESLSSTKAPASSSSCDAAQQKALECVQRAAHALPIFTDVLEVLTSVWTARHDSQLGVASSGGLSSAHRCASSWDVGGSTATSRDVHSEEDEGSRAAIAELADKPNEPVTHMANDEAVVRKVQALVAVRTAVRDVQTTEVDGATDASAALHAAHDLPLHELSTVTRNVVTFAWRAMCIRSPSSPSTRNEVACDVPPPSSQQPCVEASVLLSEEQNALLRLMRAVTRFAGFAELQRWLDMLAPCPTTWQAPPALVLSAEQEATLLCVLTRAVRRAPSWTAACEVLERVWPRLPPAHGASGFGDVRPIQRGGVAQVPALLEALLTLPHPLGQTGAAVMSDCEFWARVVGGACYSASHAADGHHADVACTLHEQHQQQWSELLFGDEARAPPAADTGPGLPPPPQPPVPSPLSLEDAGRRVEERTRAALLLVRHRLRPADALDVALRCLASSHAWCARLWAACLTTAPAPVDALVRAKTKSWTSQDAQLSSAVHLLTTSIAATVVARLADQHRTYTSLLLSSSEQDDWFSGSLQCAPHGLARQLLLGAAMHTRWNVSSSSLCAPSEQGAAVSASLACAVKELAALVHCWATAPTERGGVDRVAKLAHSNRAGEEGGGDVFPASTALIGDVGHLLADAQVAFQARGAANAAGAGADADAAPASATASLFSQARTAVTHAGLRLERAVQQATCSPAELSTGGADAAADSASLPASVSHESGSLTLSSKGAVTRLSQLRGWAKLLCTSPTDFIADEPCIVVWLYVLMRQVEELHGLAQANSRVRQPAHTLDSTALWDDASMNAELASPSSITAARVGCAAGAASGAADPIDVWSLEAEEALVRRVAQSLRRRLWPVLPPTSLLPPMLLNWLLTRGGERTWGAAVRTLRGGPAADAAHSATTEEAEAAADVASGRRFALLVLPLDRVVSIEHALRVLCTLQVVEERCAAAASSEVKHQSAGAELVHRSAAAAAGGSHPLVLPTSAVSLGGSGPPSNLATDAVLADVYAKIESVLLREWYGRALAAVLVFFASHPAHTFLTDVCEAPHHAAVQLQHRRSGSSQRRAHALRPSADPRCAGVGVDATRCITATSAVLPQSGLENLARLRGWHRWTDGSTHPPLAGVAETGEGCDDCGASGAAEPTTTDASVAVASTPFLSATPSISTGVSPTQLRVPLHLLGTFILAECRVGLDDAGLASPAATAAVPQPHIPRPRRAGPRHAILSPLSALDSLDALLRRPRPSSEARGGADVPMPPCAAPSSFSSTTRTITSTAEANTRSGAPARPVHPQLLACYLRLLQQKKREARAPAMAVEDAVAEVLKQRCEVEVLVEEEEGGAV